jgi:hypothetical protein
VIVTDALNGKTVLVGAGLAGLTWAFTRPSADTVTNYTNASISVRFFELDKKFKPISTTPALSLSIGSGITRSTNTASSQAGLFQVTAAQLGTLLGTAEAKNFAYVWYIQPVGYEAVRAFVGDGYDGRFLLAKEGYAGSQYGEIKVS